MLLGLLGSRQRQGLLVAVALLSAIFLLHLSRCETGWGTCLPTPVGSPKTQTRPHTTLPHEIAEPSQRVSYQQIQEKIKDFVKSWNRPTKGHWPPYEDYIDRDYDPNRWEAFEWNNDFYTRTGVSQIKEQQKQISGPRAYSPYPAYGFAEYRRTWRGEYTACMGPRNKFLNESEDDIVKAYSLPPGIFPTVNVGDANETGSDLSVCFDRYNRYGPYGFGQNERKSIPDWKKPDIKPDWYHVRWDELQNQCLIANQNRYAVSARHVPDTRPARASKPPEDLPTQDSMVTPHFHHRTAVLIRTWEGYQYGENDLQAIRALITETSLLSGGEYQVFLFVNVKDNNADFFGDDSVHQSILRKNVPEEFRNISILWSEKLLEEWYPEVGDWQVYWSQFMPLQWFAKTYPEFDFVWNWETDVRYLGNHYHFLEGVSEFAKQYPRKYMWERNQRYFLPAVHGSYKQWLDDTDREIERAMREKTSSPVWGPKPYNHARQKPIGPQPPTSMEEDHFNWGTGEEADLITLLPIWDPVQTEWSYRDKIWNFVPGVRPHFTPDDGVDSNFHHPEFVNIPRRVYINTVSRFSKRLLHAMHLENTAGRTMQAEMWPATVALHHGLKAVYSPHPIWMDRHWPDWYADAIFNADGGIAAQWSQAHDSAYAHDREHNYAGWSWYYDGTFAKSLYRRWLGWASQDESPLNGVGGDVFESEGETIAVPDTRSDTLPSQSTFAHVGGHGRMCLPGMLLHPVKKVFEEAEAP